MLTLYAQPQAPAMQEKPTSVLLIEEEPMLREITSFRLELLGYRVDCVESAEQALERLTDDLPDLMIVGHFLPGMSGIELIESLREAGRTLLVVEQNATRMLDVADRAYVLRSGEVVAEGTGAELREREDLFDTFVGG